MAMLVVVVGATLTLLDVGMRTAARNQEFASEIADAEAGLSRMVHEIRQATSVTATTPNSIDFLVTVAGQPATRLLRVRRGASGDVLSGVRAPERRRGRRAPGPFDGRADRTPTRQRDARRPGGARRP